MADGGGLVAYVDVRVQESQRKEALPWHRKGQHTQNQQELLRQELKNATAYGKGVYFAVDASHSINA